MTRRPAGPFCLVVALGATPTLGQSLPQMVVDLRPGPAGSRADNLHVVGPWLVFDADDGLVGGESWRTNGTVAGTTLIEDYTPGPMFWSYPDYAWIGNGLAVVSVRTYANGDVNQSLGDELWISDLTPGGTSLYMDMYPGSFGSFPGGFTRVGSSILFSAQTPATGAGVFRTDGSPGGPELVRDFDPGNVTGRTAGPVMAWRDGAIIQSNGPEGSRLWWTDGSDTGTELVADLGAINPVETIQSVFVWGDLLAFVFNDAVHARNSLYTTTGAPGAGAQFIRELSQNYYSNTWPQSAPVGSMPRLFYAVYNLNEFWEPVDHSVYALNAPNAEPALLATVPYETSVNAHGFNNLVATQGGAGGAGRVYWTVEPIDNQTQFWTSDGTAEGTRLLAMFHEVAPFPFPLGPYLIFVADDGVRGAELWISDGSTAGTRALADIWPGPGHGGSSTSSVYPEFAILGDTLFFNANDGVHGFELWSWQHPLLADCNGNSRPDHEDIADGTLRDMNHDAVPDSCQCLADWNSDGARGVEDIFAFLSNWFAGDADVDGLGGTAVPDIFAFLSLWFAGCE